MVWAWNSRDKWNLIKLFLHSRLPTQQSSNHRKGVAVVLSEKAVIAWKAAGPSLIPFQIDS